MQQLYFNPLPSLHLLTDNFNYFHFQQITIPVLGLELPPDAAFENVSDGEKPPVLPSQGSMDSPGAQQ